MTTVFLVLGYCAIAAITSLIIAIVNSKTSIVTTEASLHDKICMGAISMFWPVLFLATVLLGIFLILGKIGNLGVKK